MKAILRTNDFTESYQLVDIIKNPISEQNGLALVLIDGERWMTGGILCEVNPDIILILDSMTYEDQWLFLLQIKLPRILV